MSLTGLVRNLFASRWRELERHEHDGAALQREVLGRLMARAKDTEYGRKHLFDSVKGYDDFARNTPVVGYDDVKGDIDRMRQGESSVLWPGRVKWYAKSSGTTNDKSKFIPVSPDGLKHLHYKGGTDAVALYLRNNPQSRMFDGRGLILGGSHAPNYNLPGSLVGDLSAILIENINPIVNLVRVPKKQTALLSDFEVKRDRIAREAMTKNVTNLSGVPSWMLSVLNRVMELSGKTHLEEVWPNIEVFFHGGVAFTPYREQYRQLITSPRMHYMETYNASEGFFGLQDDPDDPSMLLMLDYDVFYEFIPLDALRVEEEGGSPAAQQAIPLWAVEAGKSYAMVISTSCGLWRYMIGDTIRFTSVNPYKFVISGRTKSFINAFGEELVVDNAEQGLAYACQMTGAVVSEYTAAPVFMDAKAKCRHQWLVEFAKRPADVAEFGRILDRKLQELNSDYEAKRYKDITLQPLELIEARPGLFNDWLKEHGKLGGQHKVPRLSNERRIMEELLKSLGGLLLLLTSCARMGSPDGGWYDDTPPRVVSATPADRETGVKSKKVTINFNEYIKLEDAQSKVIVSPPQLEMAEIRAAGKRIVVELQDSLKENTTYTVDFSDAITDNNEGNPMGNYTYSFSTGAVIDTLEVSGYCLNAENLEPIKGILVGLYEAPDSTGEQPEEGILHTTPFVRVSRTNGSGFFTIKGVAPGHYNVCALQDADGDFVFSQKSEMVGFSHDVVEPTWKPDTRQDTVWTDSLHIDNILRVPYTHFLPDDVTLLCFQEPQTDRYFLKFERQEPERFTLFFTYGSDREPRIRGLNFSADSAFVVEPSERLDTLTYWLRDTALVNRDTLTIEMTYLATDTTGVLEERADTLELLPKVSYEKRRKLELKDLEKWQKEQEKKKKRGEPYDSIRPLEPLVPKLTGTGQISPLQTVRIEMPVPLEVCDTSCIHLYSQIDTLWYKAPFLFRQTKTRRFELSAEWHEGVEYSLEIDSAAFRSIYGQTSNAIKQGIKVKTADDFSTLSIDVSGVADTASLVMELLDSGDKVQRQVLMGRERTADFFYLKPNTYYLRVYEDWNGNGQWDTGSYDDDLQAEPVYYFHEAVECKAKWDVSRSWNVSQQPRFKQKPLAITKQKPDKEKQLRNRNIERAREKGIRYLEGQGVRM